MNAGIEPSEVTPDMLDSAAKEIIGKPAGLSAEELKRALECDAQLIGINNRNLDTLVVDLEVTRRLRPLVPPGRLVVSESGIKGRDDMEKLKAWGVDAVLIGEALVTAEDVPTKIKELL